MIFIVFIFPYFHLYWLIGYNRGFRGIGGCPLGCHVLGEPQDECTEGGCVRRFDGR